ncbi:subtilisin-like serine protease QhpE [Sphingomonas adhaesiva]|uniref:subtilisin-like serine protease QhpE n=1 Tax=Sphingomonas adhaesiva TaxID=28212 RepID=UPI002FF7D455
MTARTGRGIRIAVVDSGVHPRHPHIDARQLCGGVAVARDGATMDGPDALLDRLGHGTAVTAAIQERAPDAQIVTVRVFHEALRASAAALVAAIAWSVEAGADIVNLSLGSVNPAHRGAFADAVERAVAAGVLVVAARAVESQPCWPGALDSVLGVELDWDCPRGHYRRVGAGVAVAAAGYPRPIDGVAPTRNLHGISFAVAQMSGIAACAAEALHDEDPLADLSRTLPSRLLRDADTA